MKKLVIVLAVMACVASVFAWERPQKKLIGFGWMMPRYMDQFKATVEEFERNSPFDGIGFNPLIHVIRDGRDIEYNMPFNASDSKITLTKETLYLPPLLPFFYFSFFFLLF